jgi:hypothetical protein
MQRKAIRVLDIEKMTGSGAVNVTVRSEIFLRPFDATVKVLRESFFEVFLASLWWNEVFASLFIADSVSVSQYSVNGVKVKVSHHHDHSHGHGIFILVTTSHKVVPGFQAAVSCRGSFAAKAVWVWVCRTKETAEPISRWNKAFGKNFIWNPNVYEREISEDLFLSRPS